MYEQTGEFVSTEIRVYVLVCSFPEFSSKFEKLLNLKFVLGVTSFSLETPQTQRREAKSSKPQISCDFRLCILLVWERVEYY